MLNEYYIKGSNNNGILNLVPDVSLRGEPRKVISEKLEVPLFLRQFPLSPINNIPHKNDMMSHPKYTCRSEQGVNKYQLRRHYLYKPLGPIEIMAQLLNRHYGNGGYLMNNNLFAPGEFPQKPDGEPQSQLQYIPDVGPLAYRPKMDSYGRAIMPTFTDVFGKDAKFFDPYPDVFLEEGSKNKNWTNYDAYREYYSRLKAFNEGKGPRDINAERVKLGLRPLGQGTKWTDDLRYFGYPLFGAMSLPALSLAGTGALANTVGTSGNWVGTKALPWVAKNVAPYIIGGTAYNTASKALTGSAPYEWIDYGLQKLGVSPEWSNATASVLDPAYWMFPWGKAANVLLEVPSLIKSGAKYLRLNKTYTGVPHKQVKFNGIEQYDANNNPIYMDDSFLSSFRNHTIWTSDNADYARTMATDKESTGSVFDLYTDSKGLNILDTPTPPKGEYYNWQYLPFEVKNGKIVEMPDLYKSKKYINASYDDAVNKEFDQPYNKVFLRTHHKYDFILSGGPTRRTDAVVRWSKNHGYDATDFHQLWDGDVTSTTGNYYSFPINERVLNPGAESFALPHGAPKKEVFKQILNSQDKIHFVPNIQSPVFPMLNPLIHNYYDSH